MDAPYSLKQYAAFALWIVIVCVVLGFVLITMVNKATKNMSRSSLHRPAVSEEQKQEQ